MLVRWHQPRSQNSHLLVPAVWRADSLIASISDVPFSSTKLARWSKGSWSSLSALNFSSSCGFIIVVIKRGIISNSVFYVFYVQHKKILNCEFVWMYSHSLGIWGILSPHRLKSFIYFLFLKEIFVSIYLAVLGLRCSTSTLSFSMWDLVPWPGIEARTLSTGSAVLATGLPGKSLESF